MVNFSGLSDPELVALLKFGDSHAYEEIYERYSIVLLNHAYNKTRNRVEAQDIVHEVFANLWANHECINPEDNLSGYLFTCIRNAFFNQVAHNKVQQKYLESLKEFSTYSQTITDHLVREHMLSDLIKREIENLPTKMGEVFRLSRNEHLTHKEIAEKLSISEQTVSKQITKAIKVLRVKLNIIVCLLWVILN